MPAVPSLPRPNLLAALPASLPEELEDVLHEGEGVRIVRIVSRGQASPAGFWYDQSEAEWVLLLSGEATLVLREPDEVLQLTPGDWVGIPAHRPHRVEWTPPDRDTIWLAVFHRG